MGGPGSGRKKKNAGGGNGTLTKPARTVTPQRITVSAPAVDPFQGIEAQLDQQLPPQPDAAGGGDAPAPEKPAPKAPENLVRFLWKGLYGLEDAYGRTQLGLGDDCQGIFFPPNLVEAHVAPSCKIAEKYVPAEWLQKLDENAPEIMLAVAIADAQLGFFARLAQLKKELAEKKPENNTPPPGPFPPPAGNQGYPKKNEVMA